LQQTPSATHPPPIHFRAEPSLQRRRVPDSPNQGCRSALALDKKPRCRLARWRRLRPGIERYPAPQGKPVQQKRAFTPKNDVAGPCNVVFSSNNVVARRKTTMSGLTTQLFDRTTTMFSLTTLFHAEKHQCLC
jgi:hypothetical protein